MSVTFNPGPWRVVLTPDGALVFNGDALVATVNVADRLTARLIGEAPALLSVLEELLADPYLSAGAVGDRMARVRLLVARVHEGARS
jgi:hypothetical protein